MAVKGKRAIRSWQKTVNLIIGDIAEILRRVKSAPIETVNDVTFTDLLHDLSHVRAKAQEAHDKLQEMLQEQAMATFLSPQRREELKKGDR